MSVDGMAEQDRIIARVAGCSSFDGRAYDDVPEEQDLVKDELGILVEPYAVITFGDAFPLERDRSIEGAAQQPKMMSGVVECWAATKALSRKAAGEVRVALDGFEPALDGNASEIELGGGRTFAREDILGRPSRKLSTVSFSFSFNNSIVVL